MFDNWELLKLVIISVILMTFTLDSRVSCKEKLEANPTKMLRG